MSQDCDACVHVSWHKIVFVLPRTVRHYTIDPDHIYEVVTGTTDEKLVIAKALCGRADIVIVVDDQSRVFIAQVVREGKQPPGGEPTVLHAQSYGANSQDWQDAWDYNMHSWDD